MKFIGNSALDPRQWVTPIGWFSSLITNDSVSGVFAGDEEGVIYVMRTIW